MGRSMRLSHEQTRHTFNDAQKRTNHTLRYSCSRSKEKRWDSLDDCRRFRTIEMSSFH